MGTFISFILAFCVYFLPTILAYNSGKKNMLAIAALNLFLGWTVIGWIVSLVWALTND